MQRRADIFKLIKSWMVLCKHLTNKEPFLFFQTTGKGNLFKVSDDILNVTVALHLNPYLTLEQICALLSLGVCRFSLWCPA